MQTKVAIPFSLLETILTSSTSYVVTHNSLISSQTHGVISFHLPANSGYKPMADGTFKKAGDFLPEYVLECDNGAKAIVRTYGGNCFTYITKDGIEVFGTRKDAVDPRSDSKPFAGGNPHCFPQFGPGPPTGMQHGFARGMRWIPEERAKKLSFDRMIFKLEPTEVTSYHMSYCDTNIYHLIHYIGLLTHRKHTKYGIMILNTAWM